MMTLPGEPEEEAPHPRGGDSEISVDPMTRHGDSDHPEEQRDDLLDLLEKELGNELDCSKKVEELLEKLRGESSSLEEQVVTACSAAPPKVSAALTAAAEARSSLEELLQRESCTTSMLAQHLQRGRLWVDDLGLKLQQLDAVHRPMKYLQCLQHVEELSASVQQCLMVNSVWDAIKAVEALAALDSGLGRSGCSHLQDFLRETLRFWHNIIKERLSSDFEKVLAQLHWPIISPSPLTPAANSQELGAQLELLAAQLLALQTSDDLVSPRTAASCPGQPAVQTAPPASPPSPALCLPVQIMLLPLAKRFRYHFHGNRQTNSLSKPEWYLTQVLLWIGNSAAFMEDRIQPVLDRADSNIGAKVELCRGLVALVQEKVAGDAPRMLYDDALFCHLVEEVLQFEKELRGSHAYPPAFPGLLHILLEDAVLQKWLAVEKKMAVEKMDTMLSSEGAWTSQYKDISDMDELKAPDCAETFMTLLQVITERYRALPSPSAQLHFLGLQRELADDFRIRLTQVMKEESRCPLGARYCAILNAVNYVSTILRDWGDDVFFLQLQQTAVSLGEEAALGCLGLMEAGRLASLEGSVFDGLLALLDRLRADMLGRLLDALMREVTETATPYRQERWLSVPSQHDQSAMSLSSSACPMMLCVRDRLLHLHQVLSSSLFQLAWQGLAERLDSFLYQDVVLSNHFSEGGAAQLQFDMTRNLFPLFGHYCKRPENFFKHVKEACIILCLNIGSAVLLRNVLKESEQKRSDGSDPPPESVLNEMGVYCLAPCDVLILLQLRASWPGQ